MLGEQISKFKGEFWDVAKYLLKNEEWRTFFLAFLLCTREYLYKVKIQNEKKEAYGLLSVN